MMMPAMATPTVMTPIMITLIMVMQFGRVLRITLTLKSVPAIFL